ncbi:MAG: DUF3177 family protein [Cyanobacteria bacterium P01_A01_bin.84]
MEPWFRPLVWMDYRLAVLFTVIIPLILLIWAFAQGSEAIQRLTTIYWRVASLLAITVYLMIGGYGVAFVCGLVAKILIPASLWFWVDLNDELEYQVNTPLKFTFTSWRWAISFYCILSAIASLPFLGCVVGANKASSFCNVWFQAPLLFKQYFHSGDSQEMLANVGLFGLAVYVLYFAYFVLIKLGKKGRSALQQ